MALLQFPDLSEIQQELVDINQRYDILGERLADRHQELRNIVENMKSYLQNMQELLTWIDLKELDLNIQGGLPTSEREAKKQLKEHQVKEPVYLINVIEEITSVHCWIFLLN